MKTERNENYTDSDFFNLTAEEGESQFAENPLFYPTRSSGKVSSPNVNAYKTDKYECRSPGASQAYQIERMPSYGQISK